MPARVVTDKQIVEANAEAIANVRLSHRSDISRYRNLSRKLPGQVAAKGADACYSRPAPGSRDTLFQTDNPVIAPSYEETKILQALQAALARDAANAKVSGEAIRNITLQPVPAAYTGFVRTIGKLFDLRI